MGIAVVAAAGCIDFDLVDAARLETAVAVDVAGLEYPEVAGLETAAAVAGLESAAAVAVLAGLQAVFAVGLQTVVAAVLVDFGTVAVAVAVPVA